MPASCLQSEYMHFGNRVSATLTHLLQKLIVQKNIDVYIVPPDVTIELSFINTKEMTSSSLYKVAIAEES